MAKDKDAIRSARRQAASQRAALKTELSGLETARNNLNSISSEVTYELKSYNDIKETYSLAGTKYSNMVDEEKQVLEDFSSDFKAKRDELIPLLDAKMKNIGNSIADLDRKIANYDAQLN